MRKTADNVYFKKDLKIDQYPKLDKDLKTDVLIIGGGVTGALTAYIFKENNIDVTLVEKETVASGSTLGSTSILHYEIDLDIKRLSALIGEENATKAFKICLNSVERLHEIIKSLEDECEFVLRPSFYYTYKDEEYDYIYDEYMLRKAKDFKVDFLDGEMNKDKFSFPFIAGILSHDLGAEVNPVKLTNALLKYCSNKGMPIYENTEVVEYDLENEKPIVTTRDGVKIECNKIILACGYDNLPYINEGLYSLTRTFILTTKPVDDFNGWFQRCLIKDTSDTYTYLRTTIDNRIIIGGEDIEVTLNDMDTLYMEDNHGLAKQKYHNLRQKLNYLFPNIKDIEIECEYNGIFADSPDGLPYLGLHEEYPNIYFNTSIGSNGLLYGLIGAEIILKQYLNIEDDSYKIFSFDRKK